MGLRYLSRLGVLLLILCFGVSCQKNNRIEANISSIPADVRIERFDSLFANTSVQDLPSLKKKYPYLFSNNYHDSIWVRKINDPFQQNLYQAIDSVFTDFKSLQYELEDFYRHLKYYRKTVEVPKIISLVSEVDYRNKVIVTDTLVLLSMDNYLGTNHPYYSNMYGYIKQNLKPEQLVVDLATAYAEKLFFKQQRKTFLDALIYHGKILYIKDLLLPKKTAAEKIGYTASNYSWATENEYYVWRYFIENELLFSNDPKLLMRFMNPAPFSRFNLELDRETPARIGHYMGAQIVNSYMKNNRVSLDQMLSTDAYQLFKNAKYKPRK